MVHFSPAEQKYFDELFDAAVAENQFIGTFYEKVQEFKATARGNLRKEIKDQEDQGITFGTWIERKNAMVGVLNDLLSGYCAVGGAFSVPSDKVTEPESAQLVQPESAGPAQAQSMAQPVIPGLTAEADNQAAALRSEIFGAKNAEPEAIPLQPMVEEPSRARIEERDTDVMTRGPRPTDSFRQRMDEIRRDKLKQTGATINDVKAQQDVHNAMYQYAHEKGLDPEATTSDNDFMDGMIKIMGRGHGVEENIRDGKRLMQEMFLGGVQAEERKTPIPLERAKRAGELTTDRDSTEINKGDITRELEVGLFKRIDDEKKTRSWVYSDMDIALALNPIIDLAADIEDRKLNGDPFFKSQNIRSNKYEILEGILDDIAEKRIWKSFGGVKRAIEYGENYLMMRYDLTERDVKVMKAMHGIPIGEKKSNLWKYTTAAAIILGILAGRASKPTNKNLETRLGRTTSELETRNKQIETLTDTNETLASKNEKDRKEIESLTEERDDYKESLEKTEAKLAQTSTDYNGTVAERDKAREELDQRDKEYNEAVAQRDKTQEELNEKTRKYQKLEEKLASTEKVLEINTKEFRDMSDKYLEIAKKTDDLESERRRLEKELADTKRTGASNAEAQKRYEEVKKKLTESESALVTARTELTETSRKYGNLQEQYGDLQERYNWMQKAYNLALSDQQKPTTNPVKPEDGTTNPAKPDQTGTKPVTPERKYSPIEKLLQRAGASPGYQKRVNDSYRKKSEENQKKIKELEDIEKALKE